MTLPASPGAITTSKASGNGICAGSAGKSPVPVMAAATMPPRSKSAPPSAVYARILQTALIPGRPLLWFGVQHPGARLPAPVQTDNVHPEKIGGGLAYKLQHGVPKDRSEKPIELDFEGLAQLIARFSADAKSPCTLSLEDQGRFAIGFYYEKCRKWPRFA
jgi:hypothetical protein